MSNGGTVWVAARSLETLVARLKQLGVLVMKSERGTLVSRTEDGAGAAWRRMTDEREARRWLPWEHQARPLPPKFPSSGMSLWRECTAPFRFRIMRRDSGNSGALLWAQQFWSASVTWIPEIGGPICKG